MEKESKLIKAFDTAFVPTSFVRGLWKLDRRGILFPKTENSSGLIVDFMNRKIVYTVAVICELGRLAAYYESAKTIYDMIK